MPSKIYSCALTGIEGYGVEIEVDILRGLSRFTIVGLGDTAVQESKERVRSALVNSGAEFPRQRKLINLAPADTKKSGPSFDFPIAIGLLVESKQLPTHAGEGALFLGELALDGSLRPTPGVLVAGLFAQRNGVSTLYIPAANAAEATLLKGVTVFPVKTLRDVIRHLKKEVFIPPLSESVLPKRRLTPRQPLPDLGDLKGCAQAVRAVAIAAAGGHHVLLHGPPGSGKTLLAHHLPALLPPLSEEERIELSQIYSVAGLLSSAGCFLNERPFRSVHPSASLASLVGGGSTVRPGEISLAHRGVLFLDELLEFPRSTLETLRQPLEEKWITVSRASGTTRFPANFTLVAAMNPCPCGHAGDPSKKCRCTSGERRRYQHKLSGPLLDRIDLVVTMKRLSFKDVHTDAPVDVATLLEQIRRARDRQHRRFGSTVHLNGDMTPSDVRTFCALPSSRIHLLRDAMDRKLLSARGYSRVLKVARTLADMGNSEEIHEWHLLEALGYRLNFEKTAR